MLRRHKSQFRKSVSYRAIAWLFATKSAAMATARLQLYGDIAMANYAKKYQ
jgi:hypothetical protein